VAIFIANALDREKVGEVPEEEGRKISLTGGEGGGWELFPQRKRGCVFF